MQKLRSKEQRITANKMALDWLEEKIRQLYSKENPSKEQELYLTILSYIYSLKQKDLSAIRCQTTISCIGKMKCIKYVVNERKKVLLTLRLCEENQKLISIKASLNYEQEMDAILGISIRKRGMNTIIKDRYLDKDTLKTIYERFYWFQKSQLLFNRYKDYENVLYRSVYTGQEYFSENSLQGKAKYYLGSQQLDEEEAKEKFDQQYQESLKRAIICK